MPRGNSGVALGRSATRSGQFLCPVPAGGRRAATASAWRQAGPVDRPDAAPRAGAIAAGTCSHLPVGTRSHCSAGRGALSNRGTGRTGAGQARTRERRQIRRAPGDQGCLDLSSAPPRVLTFFLAAIANSRSPSRSFGAGQTGNGANAFLAQVEAN